MALPVWGNLEKSQIDNETIEEAIARLIQAHEDDPNAHVETGESLHSHKAAAIIDHLALSIVTDKIKDLEITPAKLAAAYQFSHIWDVPDWWNHIDAGGRGLADFEGPNVDLRSGNQANDYSSLKSKAGIVHCVESGKKFVVEFFIVYATTAALSACEIYAVLESTGTQPFVGTRQHHGFKILNGDIFASVANGTNQTTVDTGINLTWGIQFTMLRVEVMPEEWAKFYINDVLVATITTNLPTYLVAEILHFQIKTTDAIDKQINFGRTLIERYK